MKKLALALLAATASLTLGGVAHAQDAAAPAPATTLTFNAAVTNDYIFRGLSQTSGKAAGQAGADFGANIFYAGAWLSNVDFGPTGNDPDNKTTLEYDLYAGVKPAVAGFNFDFGAIRYGYARAPSKAHYDYYEVKALVTKAFGPLTLGGSVFYSPEFYGKVGEATYVEGNAAYAFANKATVSGAVGHQYFDDSVKAGIDGYTTWNVGVGYPITDKFGIDLRYWGTEDDATNFYTKTFAGDRLVATLKAVF